LRRFSALLLLILLAAATAARPAADLVLIDGREIRGREVRREGGVYLVTPLEGGGVVAVPADLVREVRVVGDEPLPAPPPGLTLAEPQVLAGVEVQAPRTEDQLRVLGEPSRFQQSPIDPTWRPTSAFSDEDVLADSRSTWAESPIDPTWHPTSAFSDEDVLADSRSEWAQSPVNSSWAPKDGFARD